MTIFYEGGSVKTKLNGKEILAEMKSRTDPAHWKIMRRLQDECSHLFPKYMKNNGEQACCGCHRTPGEIGRRQLELAEEAANPPKPPPHYKGPVTIGRRPQEGEWIG